MFDLKNAAYLRLSGEILAIPSILCEGIVDMIRLSEISPSLHSE